MIGKTIDQLQVGDTAQFSKTIYMRQEANFLAPVRIGDTVTAIVEVAEIMAEKKKVRLKTYCINQEDKKVVDGEALVSPPRAPKK